MPLEQYEEIERKYDVAEGCLVPDLAGLPGVASISPPTEFVQVATYFDTADLRLMAAGVTLRRRTGGDDAGWHLKLPADGVRRTELRLPPGDVDDTAPDELLARVRVHLRDQAVHPAAVLTTRRVVHRLLDREAGVLAELCDDHVQAETSSRTPTVEEWREWELELVTGTSDLLEAAEPILLEAGAHKATMASKAARVLAEQLPARPAWRDRRGLADSPATAADLVSGYLAEHLLRLQQQDQLLRAGDKEGVHQLRVAARRLRSALATYAPVLEPGATDDLRAELKWLGGVLGDARDAQVLRTRLSAILDTESPDLAIGPVHECIDDELLGRFRKGRRDAGLALDSARYFRLLDAMEEFLTTPPLLEDARAPAERVVANLVKVDLKRLQHRARAVGTATDRVSRSLALHDVRKAAKRLRYAAESALPVFGERATELAERAEALQELLGEHQDTVVSRRTLVQTALRANLAGESGFTFGRLHAREEYRADELERAYPQVLARLPNRHVRRWLRG